MWAFQRALHQLLHSFHEKIGSPPPKANNNGHVNPSNMVSPMGSSRGKKTPCTPANNTPQDVTAIQVVGDQLHAQNGKNLERMINANEKTVYETPDGKMSTGENATSSKRKITKPSRFQDDQAKEAEETAMRKNKKPRAKK
jgi:hypothetical protein